MTDIAALGLQVDGVDNIEKARDSLGRFTKSAGDAEKGAASVGSETKKTSSALVDLVKNGSASEKALSSIASSAKSAAAQFIAVTAAAVGINEAAKTLAGFEKSVSAVQAVTRAGAKDMAAMRDVAKQLGAATEFSASQAADGFMYLGLAGWNAQQSIAAIPAVVDLATAASMGLAEAADTASNIMSAFGIAAENAAQVTDVLAAASSRANTDVSQLGEGIKYVGPVAAAMGISVGDAAAAMGVLADAGIQASMGGTGLRRVISSLANPTKEAERTLKSMGLSMDELNPKTNSLEDIVTRLADSGLSAAEALTVFGDRGGPAILALTDGVPKLRELSATLRNVDGESKRMADTMRDNLAGDFLGFKSALEGVVISLGDAGLTAVLRSSTQAATELLRAMSSLIDYTGENLPAVAASIAVVFGPTVWTAALTAVRAVGTAIFAVGSGLATIVASNPIGAIAVAAVGLLTYLYTMKDEVSEIGAVFDVVSDEVSAAFRAIKDIGVETWDVIKSGVSSLVSVFSSSGSDIELTWHEAIQGILKYTDFWINVTVSSVNVVYEAFKASFHNIGAVIANAFIDAASLITGFVDGVSGLLSSLGVDVQTNLTGWIKGGKQEIVSFSKAVTKAWKDTEVSSLAVAYQTKFAARELERAGEAAWGYSDGIVEAFYGTVPAIKENTRVITENKKALTEAEKAAKKFAEAREKAFQDQAESISKLQEERRLLEDQIATFGRGKRALEQLGIERLKEQAAVLSGFEGSERQLELLRQEIEEREKILKAGFTLDALESGKAAAEELAREVKKTHDDIEKSLTDALLRGFESGKGFGKNFIDTLKNMFSSLVLRPIIQPVAAGAAGMITGGFSGAANAQGAGAGSLFDGMSSFSPFTGFAGSSAGLVQSVGGSLASINGSLGDFGANLIMNADKIGGALDIAGAGIAYGASIYQLTQGNWGAGLGGAAGQFLGGPIGSLIGSKLGGMLDEALKGETRVGGGFAYNPTTGATNFVGGPSGGHGGSQQAVGELFKSASDTITSVLESAGVAAQLSYFHGAFESSEKGRGGVFSGGGLQVADGSVVQFGGTKKGQGFGDTSGSAEEMFGNLQRDIAFSALEAWQVVADEMPSVIGDILKGVDVRALSIEQAEATVAQITQITSSVTMLVDAFGMLPMANLQSLTFDAAAALIKFSGSLESLVEGVSTYYQNFYTQAEQQEQSLSIMSGQLSALNSAFPETRDGFRSLVDGLDLNTEAGQELYATLVGMSGAAASYYEFQDQLLAEQQSLIESFNSNFQTEQEFFSRFAKSLTDSVKDLGVELPATRDEFRELVESFMSADGAIDATGKSLLGLSDKAHDFYTELERQADAAIQAADALAREEEKLARDRVSSAQKAANDLLSAQSRIESQFASIMSSVTGSFDSLRERIAVDILKTDEEKYGYYKSQYDMLSDELAITTDASRIGQIVQEMNRAASSAYSLLDEDVRQGGKGQEYLDMIDTQRLDAVQRLNHLEEDAKKKEYEEMKQVFSEISLHLKQILDAAGGNFEGAAEAINQAAVNMEAAISNPRQRGVEVTM